MEFVPPAEELVLVTLDGVYKGEDADLLEQIASLAPRLENPQFSTSDADNAPPSIEVASAEPDSSSQASPDAGDPALRALMFGRYAGQISARIERAWIRPRTPVSDSAVDGGTFKCRVQIRQDERGNVEEVLLLQCDGTEAWRHSLVIAINQASPLPAPPTPNVFTRALTMTFEAPAYNSGMAAEGYERELPQLVGLRSEVDSPPPLNKSHQVLE